MRIRLFIWLASIILLDRNEIIEAMLGLVNVYNSKLLQFEQKEQHRRLSTVRGILHAIANNEIERENEWKKSQEKTPMRKHLFNSAENKPERKRLKQN